MLYSVQCVDQIIFYSFMHSFSFFVVAVVVVPFFGLQAMLLKMIRTINEAIYHLNEIIKCERFTDQMVHRCDIIWWLCVHACSFFAYLSRPFGIRGWNVIIFIANDDIIFLIAQCCDFLIQIFFPLLWKLQRHSTTHLQDSRR